MCTIDRKDESESRGAPLFNGNAGSVGAGGLLAAQGITHVAMEATGIYWKPIWHILEGRFELVLANAAHIRNVPGRKSDVNDAAWISDLLAHGLIRASFVPPAQIQDVRDLTRTRTQLAREAAQHIQRIQKTLENANIKLTSVISNIVGTSGRRILKAMIAGETNATKLAEFGSTRLKCPRAELTAALDGRVTAHHRFIRKGAPWLKPVLVQCAWGAARTKGSYYQAQFFRLKARRGPKKAAIAIAASLLTAAYHMLKDGTFHQDLGADFLIKRDKARIATRLANRIKDLGYEVSFTSAA
jgi:Transposase